MTIGLVLAVVALGVAALGLLDRLRPCLPVLYYHHVHPGETITPEVFEAQLRFLRDRGWRTLSMGEGLEVLRGERPFEPKTCLLTFDDGWLDNWVFAFPLLERYGMRATIFVITRLVGDGPPRANLGDGEAGSARREGLPLDRYEGYPTYAEVVAAGEAVRRPFVRWSELARMRERGVFEVQAHSETHPLVHVGPPPLGTYGPGDRGKLWWTDGRTAPGSPRFRLESGLVRRRYDGATGTWEGEEAWRARARGELEGSRRKIEARLGSKCDVLGWPFGETSPEATDLARACGFRAALTTRKGANTPGMDLMGIRRFEVNRAPLGWFRSRLWLHAHTPLAWGYGMVHRRWDRSGRWNR